MSTTPAPSETHVRFAGLDWLLSIGMALTWGSSFILIDVAIDHFHVAVVPLGRTAFGAIALIALPSARQRIDRSDYPVLLILGGTWMAFPFLLYPLAEQTVSSSIAGMMNGALPVVVAVVTAIWTSTMPSSRRVLAIIVGFTGVLLIALPSIDSGDAASPQGIGFLLLALVSYAVSTNLARPLQAKYSPASLMLHVELVACVLSLPYGLYGISQSNFAWSSLMALVALGALGTGYAFTLFSVLLKRTGIARSMIPTY
ncbi:MAG: DMT family transporter, partial [Actinomycetota bacterium]